ncbi:MAG TPA: HAD-IA family hydrolase [Candidatus Bathyarchaeia archaeon]|nr:HAD-IA family hydrolase [Candidatus Bathyarchaeia archaeon]
MSKISGILLDFDGVLSSIVVRLGWPFYNALKKIKPTISKNEILYSFNEMMKMYLHQEKRGLFYVPKMIIKISPLLKLNFIQMLRFIIILLVLIKKNSNNISPEEKADEVLQFVTKRYKTALITHAEREVINNAYQKFTYLKDIDVIIAQQDLKYTKPHPFGLNKAMKALGLNPQETIFVGDLPHDIQAGKRAGTLTCAVVNFQGAEKDKRRILQQFKPDFIINHIKELPLLLKQLEKNIF